MPVQSPADRLLTEQHAADTYRTGTQVSAAADDRIAAMLTAQKAKPSGLASLGADGLVPPAQLPPATNVPIVARLTGAGWTTGVALPGPFGGAVNAVPVPGLALTGLTAGLWEVVLEGFGSISSGGMRGWLAATDGLVAADSATATATATSATQSGRFGGLLAAGPQATYWVQANGGLGPVPIVNTQFMASFRHRGLLRVTTGGGLAARVDSTNAAGTAVVDTGTYLSAVRVGS